MFKRVLFVLCAPLAMLALVGGALAAASTPAAQAPDDFILTEYADLDRSEFGIHRDPMLLTVGPDGRVHVALESGRIYAFEDADGDDQADAHQLFAEGPAFPAGVFWQGASLYLALPGQIRLLEDQNSDGDARDTGENSEWLTGLPEPLQGLALDESGRVYVGVAADCDSCQPDDVRRGTILRFEADGSGELIHAMGLHAPADLAVHPETGDLLALDDGRDDLGPDQPPDELNWIQAGRHYGWPHCWDGGSDPQWGIFCTWAVDPLATFPAHSSPAGLTIHDGTAVPPAYAHNAFVALRDLGQIERVTLIPSGMGGYQATVSTFATGFEEPVDVALGPDGAIYVLDGTARRVYAIRARPDLSTSWKAVRPVDPPLGAVLTYTLQVRTVGPGTPFTLTDPIPISTTCVADSLWASAGTISYTGGQVVWWGNVSSNDVLTATFAVQLDTEALTGTVIVNTAHLTGTADDRSPYLLQATALVQPEQVMLPAILRSQ